MARSRSRCERTAMTGSPWPSLQMLLMVETPTCRRRRPLWLGALAAVTVSSDGNKAIEVRFNCRAAIVEPLHECFFATLMLAR